MRRTKKKLTPEEKRQREKTLINNFLAGQYTFHTKKGRLYHIGTSLNKEVRKYLKYDGQYLVEADIANSIPSFSLTLFDNYLLHTNQTCNFLLNNSNPTIFKEEVFSNYNHLIHSDSIITNNKINKNNINWTYKNNKKENNKNTISMLRNLHTSCDTYPDVKLYRERVLDGTIYDYVHNHWVEQEGTSFDRDIYKKKFLAIFNSPPHHTGKYKRLVKKLFPNVVYLIDALNHGFVRTKNGKGYVNKRRKGDIDCPYSIYTQGLEGWFVLDNLCDYLYIHYPDKIAIPIHDGILCTPDFAETVCEIIRNLSFELLGYHIMSRVKDPRNPKK